MKFKTKVKFLILGVLAAALCGLCAGCIGEMTAWDFLEGQNAMQGITYYANGGRFGQLGTEDDAKDTVDIYYREGVNIISDDFTCTGKSDYYLTRPGYTFIGWYAAKVDADGNPDYLYFDKDGNQVSADADDIAVKRLQISDTPADLSTLKKDEHRYFCADWLKNEVLLVKLVSDEAVTLEEAVTVDGETFEAGHTFNPGDAIASAIFTKSSDDTLFVTLSTISATQCNEHTFLQYYLEEACITPISRYTRGEDEQEGENSIIYAKYIKGKYTIVKDAKNVGDMLLELDSGKSYYFFNTETNEIDMAGRSVSLKNSTECNIKIYGNGFTIKNLNYNPGRSFITAGSTFSMFGKLTKDASIKDLTLKDITMNIQVRVSTASFFAITREAETGATLENVVIDGIKLTMTIPATSSLTNIPLVDGVYDTNNWLFGGEGSDEAFKQRFAGISVNKAEIEINK